MYASFTTTGTPRLPFPSPEPSVQSRRRRTESTSGALGTSRQWAVLSLSLIKSRERKDKHRVFVLHSVFALRVQYTPRRRKKYSLAAQLHSGSLTNFPLRALSHSLLQSAGKN